MMKFNPSTSNTYAVLKATIFGVILVRIFPAFSRIRIQCGEILRISPYSVRMRENAGKMQTRITLNTDSFYAVVIVETELNVEVIKTAHIKKLLGITTDQHIKVTKIFEDLCTKAKSKFHVLS